METAPSQIEGQPEHVDSVNPSPLRWLRAALVALFGLVLLTAFALACAFVYVSPALPTAETMHNVELTVPLRVYSRSGALVSQIGEQRRIPVTFEDIPPLVRQAVLAAEDDRFFEHSGLDWMGVIRALVMNVVKAGAGQGGSTAINHVSAVHESEAPGWVDSNFCTAARSPRGVRPLPSGLRAPRKSSWS